MKKFFACILSLNLLFTSVPVYAHSGRTDSSGGHHDYKNVSGLGSYHYHHGYGPHLHPNGICPYSSSSAYSSSSQSSSSSGSSYTYKSKTEVTYLGTAYKSSITAYIDGYYIPTIDYNGNTYVIAEDLNNYGFDVEWVSEERALKIKANPYKAKGQASPSLTQNSFNVIKSDIKALYYNGTTNEYVEVASYNIGGKTLINVTNIGSRYLDTQTNTLWIIL